MSVPVGIAEIHRTHRRRLKRLGGRERLAHGNSDVDRRLLLTADRLGLADADELMRAEVQQRPGRVRLGNAFIAGEHPIAAVVGHAAAYRREGARVRDLTLAQRAVDAQQQTADDKRHAPRAQIVVGRRERLHLARTGVLQLGKQHRRAQMPVQIHVLPENIGLVGITHDSFLKINMYGRNKKRRLQFS